MKNKFKYSNGRSLLVCPQCQKFLQRFDIEEYMTCPYCDYVFERSPEIENFILQPLVNQWMKQVSVQQTERLSGYADSP